MTAFYKVVESGYIIGFGTNGGDSAETISEGEYNSLSEMLQNRPTAPDGFDYLIQDSPREWVLVELPPDPDPELTDAEALEILLGGDGE